MDYSPAERRWGMAAAVLAHTMWGFFPLYWQLLDQIPSLALTGHRVVWAFLVMSIVVPILIAAGRELSWSEFRHKLFQPKVIGLYCVAALMLATNWLAFLWAVNHGAVLQASLGYYINPLLSVLLGVVVLRERLQASQWLAVGVAAVGVGIMTVAGGGLPWASLGMACAFAMYGLVKKKTPLASLPGLWVEIAILLFPATAYLVWSDARSPYPASEYGPLTWGLLAGGGLLTVMPLTLFAVSARRLPLATVGVLQYVGPTLQFFVATVINGEEFGRWRMLGFICVWTGSLLYLWRASRGGLGSSAASSRSTQQTGGNEPAPLGTPNMQVVGPATREEHRKPTSVR